MTDDRNNRELERLLNDAADAAAAEDWPRVRALVARVLAIDPQDLEAATLLEMSERSTGLPPLVPPPSPIDEFLAEDPDFETPEATGPERAASDARCAWCDSVMPPDQRYCPRCHRERSDYPQQRLATRRSGPPILALVWGVAAGALGVLTLGAILFVVLADRSSFEPTHPLPLDDSWVGVGPVATEDASCPGQGQRVCFLALGGPPPDDIEAIAAHFEISYDFPVGVLPAIDLVGQERASGDLIDHQRQQLKGEALVELLKVIYPDIWQDPQVTLVAVTPHDVFDSRNPDLNYLYSVRGVRPGRFVIVSNARMDDAAWGGEPDQSVLAERTLKLIAREIGALHYGLDFRDDPTSVMTAVFGSRAGVDRATLRIPAEELHTRNPDLVTGIRTWGGFGRGQTSIFELEPGAWEYCASIVGGIADTHSGLRASLYTEDGVWLTADSGVGREGLLGCTPIAGPGRFQVSLYASLATLEWTVAVGPRGSTPPPEVELPAWDTDSADRMVPVAVTGHSVVFDEVRGGFTPFFRPIGESWTLCWEAHEALDPNEQPDDVNYLSIELKMEEEVGSFGEWGLNTVVAGQGDCVEVPSSQPNARHWFFILEAAEQVGVKYTLKGVELVN